MARQRPEGHGRTAPPTPRWGAALEIREAHTSKLPVLAQLLARGMRDDPMHCTVFGADAGHRYECLRRFFGALLPLMGWPTSQVSRWEPALCRSHPLT